MTQMIEANVTLTREILMVLAITSNPKVVIDAVADSLGRLEVLNEWFYAVG